MEKPVFPPHFWNLLSQHNPLGRRDITPQDAKDWFDYVWPVYREYRPRVRKPNHKLRIARWWLNLTSQEIEKARVRGTELRRGDRSDSLERSAALAFTETPTPPRTDLPPLNVGRGSGND